MCEEILLREARPTVFVDLGYWSPGHGSGRDRGRLSGALYA